MKDIIASILAAFTANNTNEHYTVVPEGYQLHDTEQFEFQPRHINQTVQAITARAFCKYVSEFKGDATVIFANIKQQRFEAHLQYHSPLEGPSWNTHKIVYSCPTDSRWKIWNDADGKTMSQVDFARFIENNLPDIVTPSGSDMLTISKALQAKKAVDFKSDTRLSNGDIQFTYNETTTASAGAGSLEVPEEFTLGIPVYEGAGKYEVKARLRYRINDGKLSMWYELIRPARMVEDAFAALFDDIKTQLPDVLMLEASA